MFYGILILDKSDGGNKNDGGGGVGGCFVVETLHATSLQQHETPIQPPKNDKMAAISPKPNSVSTIIRSYKSAVTKHANRLELPNIWQTRFYDHIIRDDAEHQHISKYINDNSSNRKEDIFHTT